MKELSTTKSLVAVTGALMLSLGCGGEWTNPATPVTAAQYTAVQIGPVAPVTTAPLAINASGTVAGTGLKTGTPFPFIWSPATGIVPLTLAISPPAGSTAPTSYVSGVACSISDAGEVAGWATLAAGANVPDPGPFGVEWTSASNLLQVPATAYGTSALRGIGANGVAAGWGVDSAGVEHALEWDGQNLTDLTTSLPGCTPMAANGSFIVGAGPSGKAFSYSPSTGLTTLSPLPGQSASVANAVSPLGETVGASGSTLGCFWSASTTATAIPASATNPTLQTYAYGVNSGGQIVGGQGLGTAFASAYVTSLGGAPQLLTPITENLPIGVNLTCASGINASGQIVAYGSDGNGYLVTPVSGAAAKTRSLRMP